MDRFLFSFVEDFFKVFFKVLFWLIKNFFKILISPRIKRRKMIILGSGESLNPLIKHQELFDYSQTASATEISPFTKGNESHGDFWVGRNVQFKNSRARGNQEIWLPNEFLYQHVLIVGPPGAGKTELLLKSAGNLMRQGNLICVDAAGFLGDRLSHLARSAGSKFVSWDISGRGKQTVWNFLEELERFGTEKDIRAIAEALYGNYVPGDPNAPFWERDIMWLTGILGVVVAARKAKLVIIDPSDLPELVTDKDAIKALLHHLPDAAAAWGANLYSYLSLPDDRFALDISFLQKKLNPFKDTDVQAICDGSSEIFILPALNQKTRHTLVIGQSLSDGKFGSALAAVMIRYAMNVLYRRMRNRTHRWTPTYIICDEAPRLKNLNFEEMTAIGRNADTGIFLMCQSVDQFPKETLPALNNCRSQLFLQGVSYSTAEWLSKQLGDYQRPVMNLSLTGNPFAIAPVKEKNISYERVPILGIREITSRPYSALPSGLSAIVRINASRSPTSKVFLTDYFTKS